MDLLVTSNSAWRFALLRHRVRSARDDTRGKTMEKFANLKCHFAVTIDILYTLDSASLLVKLKPRIFQRLPPFE
jgi:hypothetical protein